MVPPGKPHWLLPPATAMFSMPDQRLPRNAETLSFGTTRHTCGEREVRKSFTSGSFRTRVLPLMETISLACITERQRGTVLIAVELALARSLTLIAPAPVLGAAQEYVGCRLKNWASRKQR